MRLKITGGRLYDPADGLQGEVRDLYIDGDRIVPPLAAVDRVLEVRGRAVLPAGIDLRGQVATYGLDYLRLGRGGASPRELGEAYARLGYTHVHEPFLTLFTAGYVHRELAALPMVDTSASLVLNLREVDLRLRSPEGLTEVGEALGVLLDRTRCLNLRVVEPYVRYRQDFYAPRRLATDKVLELLAELARRENLTLALEASPEVLRAAWPDPESFHLAALGPALMEDDLIEAALGHLERGVTADLGLMALASISAPTTPPVKIDMGWFQPLSLNPERSPAQARRALSLGLQYQGANLAFSGDGPALALLEDYPRFFSWLGDRTARPADWQETRGLREYTLSDWVWATRTLPARLLGLKDRGRLTPGARADVAIFDLPAEAEHQHWTRFLGRCRTLLKAGEIVVEDFAVVHPQVPKAAYYRQSHAPAGPLVEEICGYRSFRPENLWPREGLGGPWVGV